MKKRTTTFLTLMVGVALLRAATRADQVNQSKLSFADDQPMGSQENPAEQRGDTPEVVLQLKYDGGALNRIYLAQFRKTQPEWQPSVPSRTNLCADLCSAGLGGETCGSSCQDLIPIGLKSALQESANSSSAYLGEPRTSVCPTLCNYHLGDPLCNCGREELGVMEQIDWAAVCRAFCVSDRYVLGGCPSCETISSHSEALASSNRALATAEGWAAWCGVQCRQGHGGAACNCDRAPFQ